MPKPVAYRQLSVTTAGGAVLIGRPDGLFVRMRCGGCGATGTVTLLSANDHAAACTAEEP